MITLALLLFLQDDPAKLVDQLRSDDPDVRDKAELTLKALGKDARPALQRVKDDPDPEVSSRVKRLLRILDLSESLPPRLLKAIPRLVERLATDDPHAWTEAMFEAAMVGGSLGRFHPELTAKDLMFLADRAFEGARDAKELAHLLWSAHAFELRALERKATDLLGHDSPEVRKAALEALVRFRGKRSSPEILRSLSDKDGSVRRRALEMIGTYDLMSLAPQVVPFLDDPAGRDAASDTLCLLVPASAIPGLLTLLRDDDPETRIAALDILRVLRPSNVTDKVRPLLSDSDASIRAEAVWTYAAVAGPSAVSDLVTLLQDDERDVRKSAAHSLAYLKADAAVPALISMAESADAEDRLLAVTKLAQISGADSAPHLRKRLSDADPNVRAAAIDAVGRIRDRDADLWPLLEDPSTSVRLSAAYILLALDAEDAPKRVATLLDADDPEVRIGAVRALGSHPTRPTILHLRRAMRSLDESIRLSALNALIDLRAPEAADDVVKLMTDPSSKVRASAARTLARLAPSNAAKQILPLVKDPEVRHEAVWLIRCLDRRTLGPQLVELLEHEDSGVRSAALELAQYSDAGVPAAPLVKLLADPKANLRAGALVALGALDHYESASDASRLLDDPDRLVQEQAFGTVATLMGRDSLAHLLPRLSDTDYTLREKAFSCIHYVDFDELVRQLTFLAESKSDEIRTWAQDKLLKMDTPWGRNENLRRLTDEDPNARRMAVSYFTYSGRASDLEALLRLASDEDEDVRAAVLCAVRNLRGKRHLKILISGLRDDAGQVRRYAVETLHEFHITDAAADITPLLNDEDAEVRRAAFDAIRELRPPSAAPALVALLTSEVVGIRAQAAEALAVIGGDEVIRPLIACLRDTFKEVQREALRSLTRRRAKDAAPEIIALLEGKIPQGVSLSTCASCIDDGSYADAIDALTSLPYPEAAPVVRRFLTPGNAPRTRISAINFLAGLLGRDAIKDIRALLDDSDTSVLAAVASSLAAIGDRSLFPDLIPLLDDPRRIVFDAALDAVESQAQREDAPRFEPFLRNDDPQLRGWAGRLLLNLRGKDALPAIASLLEDPAVERESLLRTMVDLKLKEAVPLIRKCLQESSSSVRSNAIYYLSRLEGSGAADVIRKCLEDRDSYVRASAIESLARICGASAADTILPFISDRNPNIRRVASKAAARLGRREGVEEVLRQDYLNRFCLNAVREPETWDRLQKVTPPKTTRTRRDHLSALAQSAGLKLEFFDPLTQDEREWLDATGTWVEDLEALLEDSYHLSVVIESDRLRILPCDEAHAFWRDWWDRTK